MVFSAKSRRLIEQLNAQADVADTAAGPVEFARHGGAPYLLILHGTPQGHHASFMGEPFRDAGYGTITPSRPGYLRTPLSSGRSFAQQADAAAALLDTLQIDQVAVFAISGGGPSGIHFAARHPDRTRALILEVAISQHWDLPVSQFQLALFMSPAARWLQSQIMKFRPRIIVDQLLQMESTLDTPERARVRDRILADPRQLAALRQFIDSSPPFRLMRPGFDNDMAQFRRLDLQDADRLPRQQIQSPTLIVHGTHDRDVPYQHAQTAARDIPNAQLHIIPNGWHLLPFSDDPETYQQTQIAFLHQHCPV